MDTDLFAELQQARIDLGNAINCLLNIQDEAERQGANVHDFGMIAKTIYELRHIVNQRMDAIERRIDSASGKIKT